MLTPTPPPATVWDVETKPLHGYMCSHGNIRTDGILWCCHNERVAMKLTKTDDEIKRGRQAQPNPFLEAKTLEALKGGEVFRINVEKDEKANTIVTQMRKAAETVDMRVSVALDEGTERLTDSKTFRVQWKAKPESK